MGMTSEREVKEMKMDLSEESDVSIQGFKKSRGKFIKNRTTSSKLGEAGPSGVANRNDYEIFWDNETTSKSEDMTSYISMEGSSSTDGPSKGVYHVNKSATMCRHCGARGHKGKHSGPPYCSKPGMRQRSCKRMKSTKGSCRNCHKSTVSREGHYQINRKLLAGSLGDDLDSGTSREIPRMKTFGGKWSILFLYVFCEVF